MSEKTEEGKVEKPDKPSEPPLSFADFLESHPPGSSVKIPDLAEAAQYGQLRFKTPELQLFCESEICGGVRMFRSSGAPYIKLNEWAYDYLVYACRNCGKRVKRYALAAKVTEGYTGFVYKVGELPEFGPPTPARVIRLIGPDRELFLRGRRSENQGLGIGAFAYYRRVVDNQWKRLLGEIVRVAERVKVRPEVIKILQKAQTETQFKKAVEMVKDSIPDVLLIHGHNPITLLYKALSDGLHDQSDEVCLESAESVRVILTELADRIGQALKDDAELRGAVSRLMSGPKHEASPESPSDAEGQ